MKVDIPGLIEQGEFDILTEYAGSVDPGSAIVEFGCYLGRSTSAILKGANPIKDTKIFVFDAFSIRGNDPFAQTMVGHVNKLGLTELIYRDKNGFLHWEKVFDHLIQSHSNKNLVWEKCDCSEATWQGDHEIAMIHLDAPKDYYELRPILLRFFGALKNGSIIIFQDFFYHWSASVILAVALMEKKRFIEFEKSFASSLHVRVIKNFSLQDLIDLDLDFNKSDVFDELDEVLKTLDSNRDKFDRYEKFRSRIELAYLAEAVSSRNGDKAAIKLHNMLVNQSFADNPQVISDFLELFRKNFSIK